MMILKAPRLALVSTVSVLSLCGAAHAVDPAAFAQRLQDIYATGNYTIVLDAGTEQGADLVYPGVTVSIAGMSMDPVHLATELTFTNVAETGDGGFTADSLTVPDVDVTEGGNTITLADIEATGIYLAGGTVDSADLLANIGEVSTGAFAFTMGDTEIVSFTSMTAGNEFTPSQNSDTLESIFSEYEIAGLSIDLSMAQAGEGAALVAALGVDELNGSISGEGDWTLADGRLDLSSIAFDIEELGRLDFALDMTGYTLALLEQMQAQQEAAMAEGMTDEQRQAAQAAAGMALISQLSLNGASIRFDDASLTEKLIAFTAGQQSIDPMQMREAFKIQATQMVQALGSPELTDMVTQAVGAFLDNPQSIELSAEPTEPLSFAAIAAAAASPANLISTLGVMLTANQPAEE